MKLKRHWLDCLIYSKTQNSEDTIPQTAIQKNDDVEIEKSAEHSDSFAVHNEKLNNIDFKQNVASLFLI